MIFHGIPTNRDEDIRDTFTRLSTRLSPHQALFLCVFLCFLLRYLTPSGEVCLISAESDNYRWVGLTLEFADPCARFLQRCRLGNVVYDDSAVCITVVHRGLMWR